MHESGRSCGGKLELWAGELGWSYTLEHHKIWNLQNKQKYNTFLKNYDLQTNYYFIVLIDDFWSAQIAQY